MHSSSASMAAGDHSPVLLEIVDRGERLITRASLRAHLAKQRGKNKDH
jgi:hypothetical protein